VDTAAESHASEAQLFFNPSRGRAWWHRATLTIGSDGATAPTVISLEAIELRTDLPGRDPDFVPDWLDFPAQQVGTTSPPVSFVIANQGGLPLNVRAISLLGTNVADFALTSDCVGHPMLPNQTCTAAITFAPRAAGPRSAQLLLDFFTESYTYRSVTGVGVGGGPPAIATANYQGLWWNPSESGWGINLAHQGDQIYLTWYTYDAAGKALWLAMLASKIAPGSYAGDILEVHGPPFSAVPFVPPPTANVVGNGTLTFSDASNGTFAYTAKGATQSKAIARFVFGPQPTCSHAAAPNFAAATNYQDLWWNPAKSGWGINLAHQGNQIYATWYTYDVDRSPLWLASLMTAGGAGTYTGALLRFNGPAFSTVPYPPSAAPLTVGNATLTFSNGNAAFWSYTIGSTSGSEPMSRFLFAEPAGTVCQ
jgi:hypothetical protein